MGPLNHQKQGMGTTKSSPNDPSCFLCSPLTALALISIKQPSGLHRNGGSALFCCITSNPLRKDPFYYPFSVLSTARSIPFPCISSDFFSLWRPHKQHGNPLDHYQGTSYILKSPAPKGSAVTFNHFSSKISGSKISGSENAHSTQILRSRVL